MGKEIPHDHLDRFGMFRSRRQVEIMKNLCYCIRDDEYSHFTHTNGTEFHTLSFLPGGHYDYDQFNKVRLISVQFSSEQMVISVWYCHSSDQNLGIYAGLRYLALTLLSVSAQTTCLHNNNAAFLTRQVQLW